MLRDDTWEAAAFLVPNVLVELLHQTILKRTKETGYSGVRNGYH